MKQIYFQFVILLSAATMFTACGDEVTEVNESTGLDLVSLFSELPECTEANVGEMAFVSDSAKVYYCAEGAWTTLNGEDGKDGTDGTDGKDGEDGATGSVGESSSSSVGIIEYKPNWVYLNPYIDYGMFKDIRDGQVYKTVQIGTQTWMAENLNYADSIKTTSLKGKSWCYENSADSCAKYGRLYTWAAAIDSVTLALDGLTCGYGETCTLPSKVKGICPEGWHLPDITEFKVLSDYVKDNRNIGDDSVGFYLKSFSDWRLSEDGFGFSALPAGVRNSDGSFVYMGSYVYFWSATEDGDNSKSKAYSRYLLYSNENFYSNNVNSKNRAFSVRCLKDAE